MDGQAIPPRPGQPPPGLVRTCEASRLQRQLLAQAYQRLCPDIRRKLEQSAARTPTADWNPAFPAAARVAAGA
jgi:hypothetical protein